MWCIGLLFGHDARHIDIGLTLTTPPRVGTTLIVLDGPGVGQSRLIKSLGSDNNTVILESPLDGWVVPNKPNNSHHATKGPRPSIVAVVSSFGSKIIAGNSFNWTEVVQWYGNTLRGVMADNSFSDCNVLPGGNINHGAMGAVGECYHGAVLSLSNASLSRYNLELIACIY
jgi:hypothetical protein